MNKDYLYGHIKLLNKAIILIGVMIPLFSYKGNMSYFEKLIDILNNNWFLITNLIAICLIVFRTFIFYDNIYFKQRTVGVIDSKIKVIANVFYNCLKNSIFAIVLSSILTFFIMNLDIKFNMQQLLVCFKYSMYFIIVSLFFSSVLIFFIDNFNNKGFIISSIFLFILINYINLNMDLFEIVLFILCIVVLNNLFLFINRRKEYK